jgi:hypothetical protein
MSDGGERFQDFEGGYGDARPVSNSKEIRALSGAAATAFGVGQSNY